MMFMLGLAMLTTTVVVKAQAQVILSKDKKNPYERVPPRRAQKQQDKQKPKPTTRQGVVHPDGHPGRHW